MQHPSDLRLMAFALHSLRKLCSVYHCENPTIWNLSIWQTQMHLMNKVNHWIWREKKSPCEIPHLKYMCVRIGCVCVFCSPMQKKEVLPSSLWVRFPAAWCKLKYLNLISTDNKCSQLNVRPWVQDTPRNYPNFVIILKIHNFLRNHLFLRCFQNINRVMV